MEKRDAGVGVQAIVASRVLGGIETRNSTRRSALTPQALETTTYLELNVQNLESDTAAVVMRNVRDTGQDIDEFREARAPYLLCRHGNMACFFDERGVIDAERLRSAIAPIDIHNERVRTFRAGRGDSFADG